jgi:hypothetical protein
MSEQSALTCLETWIRFIDNVNTALTANNAAIAVTRLKGAKRILDFHSLSPISGAGRAWFILVSIPTRAGNGGYNWDRTSDPFDVNEVLSR